MEDLELIWKLRGALADEVAYGNTQTNIEQGLSLVSVA